MQYKYLISRWVDPLVAIGLGTSAYFVYEYRNERPEGHTLYELYLRWREENDRK